MREEFETINIHTSLTKAGYRITADGDCWAIEEPATRRSPQWTRGLRSMREAMQWASGIEAARAIFTRWT